MEWYEILLPLALILFLSKILGISSVKIGLPAVIGMLITGILISLLEYIPAVKLQEPGIGLFIYNAFFSENIKNVYSILAKIGVVLIMFSAGLGTDLKQIKATGKSALVITFFGVVTPMLLGFLVAFLFDYYTPIDLIGNGNGTIGEFHILSDLFYGAILTATSVSITVATLKELGKLNSKVGTAIVAAAVIDDVIGIVILSILTGLSGKGESSSNAFGTWFQPGAALVAIKIILFFIFAIGVGLLFRKIFSRMNTRYPNHRRNSIFAIALGFLFAYVAEAVFGVADITGAYLAGLMLCGLSETSYEEQKTDNLGYLIFTPMFFANIGISYFEFSSFSGIWLAFGLCYVVVALLGKLVGCGFGGKLCKFNNSDCTKIGLGMMVRAEVVLVCAQTGIASGLVSSNISSYVCLLIIISSFLSPLFMKLIYKKEEEKMSSTPIEKQV